MSEGEAGMRLWAGLVFYGWAVSELVAAEGLARVLAAVVLVLAARWITQGIRS